MHTIANDSMMWKEMIGAMMNNKNIMLMIQEHQTIMMGNQQMLGMMQNITGNKRMNSTKMGGMGK